MLLSVDPSTPLPLDADAGCCRQILVLTRRKRVMVMTVRRIWKKHVIHY
jgi:hypothetical protein